MFQWDAGFFDLQGLQRLAGLIAVHVRQGDALLLEGDLGTGKTTFARALITAIAHDADLEVPSPTFSLLQSYATAHGSVHHYDLYRLGGPAEVRDIGFEEALATGLVLIEWPDRATGLLPADQLRLRFGDAPDPDQRHLRFIGEGAWAERLAHVRQVHRLLASSGWSGACVRHLAGDASRRSYARLGDRGRNCLLMDSPPLADGPPVKDGKPYWAVARLAHDVRAFAAIDATLRGYGLSAPAILAHDLDAGLLLVEDFGDRDFAAAMREGVTMRTLYGAAAEVLAELASLPVPGSLPIPGGGAHRLPAYDLEALLIEARLLLDWYWPRIVGAPAPVTVADEFVALWRQTLAPVTASQLSWVLRDAHSPNLFWLPEREGLAAVGLIDFQDALVGHGAYDLAALLQDARLDVPEAVEADVRSHYMTLRHQRDASFDAPAFLYAYAVLGAQRSTKILGIFARLASRDAKPAYLAHLPRIQRYLRRNLRHPGLAALRAWYQRHLAG